MSDFNFFYNYTCFVPAIAFLVTVIFKWLCIKLSTWKINIARSLWSGWMPSAHSALISSLSTAMAIKYWLASDMFALSITMMVIIIYDAVNVRYEAWLHWEALNKILDKEKFKEVLWHLPSEAFAWAILWILVAFTLYFI